MNISGYYNLHDIVRELELALQIEDNDFKVKNMDMLVDNIKHKINRQYMVDLTDRKVDDGSFVLSGEQESLMVFVENIARIHAKLCGYCQIKRYTVTSDVSLENVNYLGQVPRSLKVNLKALQRKVLQPKAGDCIAVIKSKFPNLTNSWEKRLFVLMVVCYELGFSELTACIAEIFYQVIQIEGGAYDSGSDRY